MLTPIRLLGAPDGREADDVPCAGNAHRHRRTRGEKKRTLMGNDTPTKGLRPHDATPRCSPKMGQRPFPLQQDRRDAPETERETPYDCLEDSPLTTLTN